MSKQYKIYFVVLTGFLLFVSLNRHSRHPNFDYHSQLFSDKAGYQVYLPAFFYYDMQADNMPARIDTLTGTGFYFNENKIVTKYPIGVAILHSPFFGVAAAYDYFKGETRFLGYTDAQHIALNYSTLFYGLVGLILLFLTLVRYFSVSEKVSFGVILLVVFCSNFLYYCTRDSGMSHVFSFSVFSLIQYLICKVGCSQEVKRSDTILLMLAFGFIVALRPLNLMFVSIAITYLLYHFRSSWGVVLRKVEIKTVLLGLFLAILPLALQGLYYNYSYGQWLADSYSNETFSNIHNLKLGTFWFALHNGVFIYSPLFFLVFYGVYKMARHFDLSALSYFVFFLVISLTYAAWWSPTLGCGFGNRGFTEHLAFFALPMAFGLNMLGRKTLTVILFVGIAVSILLFIQQWNFEGCWWGISPWDWNEYLRLSGC